MKEDKHLKELLQQTLFEETSADFTERLMQRVNTVSASEVYTRSLWEDNLFKIIAGAFIFVSVFLLVLTISFEKIALSFNWKLELPSALSFQLIQFLLVFWLVMIANQLISARSQKEP